MIVGIDVAKHKHFAKILFPDGSESPPFWFSNHRKGFETFPQGCGGGNGTVVPNFPLFLPGFTDMAYHRGCPE